MPTARTYDECISLLDEHDIDYRAYTVAKHGRNMYYICFCEHIIEFDMERKITNVEVPLLNIHVYCNNIMCNGSSHCVWFKWDDNYCTYVNTGGPQYAN